MLPPIALRPRQMATAPVDTDRPPAAAAVAAAPTGVSVHFELAGVEPMVLTLARESDVLAHAEAYLKRVYYHGVELGPQERVINALRLRLPLPLLNLQRLHLVGELAEGPLAVRLEGSPRLEGSVPPPPPPPPRSVSRV